MSRAKGIHLFPFRTEKLSPLAPMVLPTGGRVGRRRIWWERVTEMWLSLFFLVVGGMLFMAGRVYSWYGCLFLCCLWLVVKSFVDIKSRQSWLVYIVDSLFVFSVIVSFIYTLWGCFFCLNTFARFCFLYLPPVSVSVPALSSSVPVFILIYSAAFLLFICMLWVVVSSCLPFCF